MSLFFIGFFIIFFFYISFYVGISLNSGNYTNYIISYTLDTSSNYCLLMLFFCVSISLFFSIHYFQWSFSYLNSLICFFVLVMITLVISNNLFNSLLGWEYLGFVSFILILFYSTYDSVRAANTTLVSSRFGDVGLFVLIGLTFNYLGYPFVIFLLCFFLIIATKSACIPFTSWLLEAMRAPTPVSCLVHSSTLVAAGIWFLCHYGYLLEADYSIYFLIPCIFTIVVSSLSSLFFLDVKKLVALSTCNNICWCAVYYFMGFGELCLIQLFSHGVAKCMLFCTVGDILSSSGSNQINSGLYSGIYQNYFSSLLPCLLILFVSGLPFQGVFFSKHYLLSINSYSFNPLFLIGLYLCVFLTYLYSFRLFFMVSNIFSGQSSGFQTSFFFLGGLVIIGCLFNFILSYNLEEFLPLFVVFSGVVTLSQLLGLLLSILFNSNKSTYFSSLLFGQDFLVYLSSFFFNTACLGIFYISNFRLERYFSSFLNNLNIFSINLNGIIQLNIFFCFMCISAFFLFT
uniref:NADH:ubiquinone reductase (H(+)-translocating) n=1 Tax=Capsala katsuwoni TaxID=2904576 RepID=A0A8T9JD09_9PLAT|nr:NADH dehydrogenase subunit 5 [Capsala katsuwoni]UOK11869.1 NADH dehydrogenase subunit 5 [Capsala katsuwoni]